MRGEHEHDPELEYLKDIRFELGLLNQALRNSVLTQEMILELLQNSLVKSATGFKIFQIIGDEMQSDIQGTVKGATSQFTSTLDPAGSVAQAGLVPTWKSSNPAVSLTASADGFGVNVATSASDTASGYDLTESGFDDKGNAISTTVQVSYIGGTGGVSASGFNIKQVS